jgi:hypothetical protein
MKPVRREEILDLAAYERSREEVRSGVMAAKAKRRIHVAGALTFLFENTATIRYQIQEMVRVERMSREQDIRHEIDTYNELLGGPGELGCSLLIEIPDPAERDRKLREWLPLLGHLYAKLPDGRKVRATYDPRQVGTDRLSSVQYLKFDVKGEAPVALGTDLPALSGEAALTPEQREALRQDLAG